MKLIFLLSFEILAIDFGHDPVSSLGNREDS
jgi:hypothetical protein